MLRNIALVFLTVTTASLSATTSQQPKALTTQRPLEAHKLKQDPFDQFQVWYREAKKSLGAQKASTVILATLNQAGDVSTRSLQAHFVDRNDISFFGDLRSQKFQDLQHDPTAAVTFYWADLQHQVNICGKVIPISKQEAFEVFNSQSKMEQITALASNQDEYIFNYNQLEEKHIALVKDYEGKIVPMPEHWGGFRFVPQRIEFWQAGPHGLHSRVHYEKKGGTWEKETLSP